MLTRPSTATWLLLAPGLGLLLAFVVTPVLLTAWISLNEWSMYTPLSGMTYVGLKNYLSLFGDRVFNAALRNTLAYAGLCLVLILPLSFLLGQFLYRGLARGRAALRSVLIFIACPTAVARTASAPCWFTVPPTTVAPGAFSTGTGSPVIIDSST